MKKLLIAVLAAVGLLSTAGQARAENIIALTSAVAGAQSIINFDSATPGAASIPRIVSGLQANETLVGIDFRPANGLLYGLTTANRIYTIDQATGAASFVSTLNAAQNGGSFGFDFNPAIDRLRVVSNLDQNLRINVATGETIIDGPLAFAGTDPNAGQNPNIVGSAYTNNFAGATTTTLYGIDSNLNILVTQNPANNGTLNTVGALGFDASDMAGFDISGLTGTAYAALSPVNGFSSLFTINLNTGAATLIGQIRLFTGFQLIGIAAPVGAAAIPEPATMLLFGAGLVGIAATLRRRRNS